MQDALDDHRDCGCLLLAKNDEEKTMLGRLHGHLKSASQPTRFKSDEPKREPKRELKPAPATRRQKAGTPVNRLCRGGSETACKEFCTEMQRQGFSRAAQLSCERSCEYHCNDYVR